MYQLPCLSPSEVLIYLRKSRADDPMLTVSEVLSKHEEMLNEYCMRVFGALVPEENRFREVVSGETLDSRPQMLKVLRLIEKPEYKAILVVEPQRLSRGDLEDIGRISKILRYTKTIVLTLQYSYDASDARDRDDLERELKRGNEYLEYVKRIMANGRVLSVKRGCFIGNKPPYGYKKKAIKEDRRTLYTLEPDPAEAPFVKIAFDLAARGMGATTIARRLDELGAPTRTGKPWTTATILGMLRNPHYIGKVFWGRRKGVTTVEGGELQYTRPWSGDYLLTDGLHEALIDEELWSRIRDRKAPPRNKIDFSLKNPLAGLLFCACGHAMVRRIYTKNGTERCTPRVLCGNQSRCGQSSVRYDELITYVVSALRRSLRDLDVRIRSAGAGEHVDNSDEIAVLKRRVRELEDLEVAYWDRYARDQMPQRVFDQLNEKRKKDLASAQSALEKLESASRCVDALSSFRAQLSDAIELLRADHVDVAQANALLRSCVDRITYSRPDGTRPPKLTIKLKL